MILTLLILGFVVSIGVGLYLELSEQRRLARMARDFKLRGNS